MKPVKPHPHFKLTPHVRGGWQKRYKGKVYYIPERDPDEAWSHWEAKKKALDAGRDLPKAIRHGGSWTVGRVANRYADQREADHAAGRLSLKELQAYRDHLFGMVKAFGATTLYSDLRPDDFTRLYRRWEKAGLGAHAIGNRVKVVRACWRFAEDHEWIPRRPRFGSIFRKPSTGKKQGRRPDPSEVLRVCAATENPQVEAMILLMMNCGYTAKDCAALPRSAVDLDAGLIVFPRPKMMRRRPIERAATLWAESVEALREVMAERPDDALVFRTRHGRPWVRDKVSRKGRGHSIDVVSWQFRQVCTAIGLKAFGPSWIRHLVSTIADELEKPNAKARLMGHRLAGMSEVYVDHVENFRLKEITDHLRGRFFKQTPPTYPAPPVPGASSGASRNVPGGPLPRGESGTA